MAPLFFWPVMFLTMAAALWQIDAVTLKFKSQPARAYRREIVSLFVLGWSFGFGYFLVTLYWIGASFLVEADKYAALMPLAVLVLPALLAIFYGLGVCLTRLYWPTGPVRVITLALSLFAVDWLRGNILTGFPWQLIGHSLTGPLPLMQSLSLFSIYTLTPIAVIIFASPAALLSPSPKPLEGERDTKAGHGNRASLLPLFLSLSLLLSLWGYGTWRLHSNPAGEKSQAQKQAVNLLLIQPGVPQTDKVRPERRIAATRKVMTLTRKTLLKAREVEKNKQTKRLIIWPETAILFALNQSKPLQDEIASLLEESETLITGAYKVTGQLPVNFKVYNSLFVLNHQGKITASYDKHHLVPFGEYLPWPNLMRAIGLKALVEQRGGFGLGPEPEPVALEGAPSFIPFICYEVIFPRYVSETKDAGWLLNLSNDAWFGKTAGPHQHAHMARLRSVETGLPMVRLANNGITAVYDGLGRAVALLPMTTQGTLSHILPDPVDRPASDTHSFLLFLTVVLTSAGILTLSKSFDN